MGTSDKESKLSHFRFGDGRVLERYSNEKGLNRPDGPALVEYRADGTILAQQFWENGVRVDRTPNEPSKQAIKVRSTDHSRS
jgi:hypothetical protein